MKEPLLSVLLCTYNDEKYIKQAIDSILSQTFKDFEFIIVNDGSTDRTLEIIKQIRDTRIVLIDKSNTGLTDSLNIGVAVSKSNWIARIDGDDVAFENKFEEQVKFLKDNVAVIGTQCEYINEYGIIGARSHLPLTHNSIFKRGNSFKAMFIHPSVIINKKLLLKVGGFDKKIFAAEDLDLWLKLSNFGELLNLKEVYLQYRIHPNKISFLKRDEQMLNAAIAIFKNRNRIYRTITDKEYEVLRKSISNNFIFKMILFFSKKNIGKTGVVLKIYNLIVIVLFSILKLCSFRIN